MYSLLDSGNIPVVTADGTVEVIVDVTVDEPADETVVHASTHSIAVPTQRQCSMYRKGSLYTYDEIMCWKTPWYAKRCKLLIPCVHSKYSKCDINKCTSGHEFTRDCSYDKIYRLHEVDSDFNFPGFMLTIEEAPILLASMLRHYKLGFLIPTFSKDSFPKNIGTYAINEYVLTHFNYDVLQYCNIVFELLKFMIDGVFTRCKPHKYTPNLAPVKPYFDAAIEAKMKAICRAQRLNRIAVLAGLSNEECDYLARGHKPTQGMIEKLRPLIKENPVCFDCFINTVQFLGINW